METYLGIRGRIFADLSAPLCFCPKNFSKKIHKGGPFCFENFSQKLKIFKQFLLKNCIFLSKNLPKNAIFRSKKGQKIFFGRLPPPENFFWLRPCLWIKIIHLYRKSFK